MKKLNGKSLIITICLLIVLCAVILFEIAIFISGPSRKYEDQISLQKEKITSDYRDIKELERHVFQYVVYVGEDKETYVWFNEDSKAITSRKKNTYDSTAVEAKIKKDYAAKDISISLGYGYNNPVYVVKCDKGTILLDYDTLKEAYYEMKGDLL